jgi:hypothetical protein
MIILKSKQIVEIDLNLYGSNKIIVSVYHDEPKDRYYYTLSDADTSEERFKSGLVSGEVESRMDAFKHIGAWYEEPGN